jgi:putative hemolysin
MDPQWQIGVARLVRRNSAPVVPIFFPGGNGMAFQAAGLLHRHLRTVLLPRQLLNKQGAVLDMKIGEIIPVKRLRSFSADRDLVNYLRLRTYLLGQRPASVAAPPLQAGGTDETQQPLAPPVPREELAAEINSLPEPALLHEHGAYQVWCVRAAEAPLLLHEVGRLRELTFRGHGEGTGRSLDLDRFDPHYLHLFAWHRERREIVGAYRLGACDDLIHHHGIDGLYTSTLFHYRPKLFGKIGPALELGRSFVCPEYQKSFAPLLLLWQGIGAFLVRNPRYRVLFGPVSISREYRDLSRQLMTASLIRHMTIPALASLVEPRIPVDTALPRFKGCPPQLAETFAGNIDQLNALVADLETDQKGLPVLLRHYLNLGGKLLAFNLDPDFSEVIDGLILVDLDQTDKRTLERYLGKEGTAFFRAHAGRHVIRPAA